MKTVFLKPRFEDLKLHSLYDQLIENPPLSYKIITSEFTQKHSLTKVISKHHNFIYKQFLYYFGSLPYVLKQLSESTNKYGKYDLVFASQHIISSQRPWIVDLEYANALAGYLDLSLCKTIISKKLSGPSCKAILPWSNWAKETLMNSFDCTKFKEKIQVVRYTVNPKKIKNLKKDNDKLRILFLATTNPANIDSYEFKGLYETVHAFLDLQNEYDNLELIIRSKVTPEIRKLIDNNSNIKLIENWISSQDLDNLFHTVDIFPHVGFEAMNLSVLEAMSYGLPVIATRIYNTPEAIKDMKNGILINLPKPELFYTKNGTPNDYSKTFMDSMKVTRPYLTKKVKEAMRLLIDDKSLRNKIGSEARLTIEEGEFSIKKRNSLLKEIFDNATS